MNIATAPDGAGAVVRLAGRLDGEAALQLADALERLLRDGRRSVLLDMSGVTYLSSPGTLALQQAHQDYLAARGELRVASPSPAKRPRPSPLADLLPRLLAQSPPAGDAAGPPPVAASTRATTGACPPRSRARGTYEVSSRDPGAELYCRVHGRAEAAVRSWIDSGDYRPFEFPEDVVRPRHRRARHGPGPGRPPAGRDRRRRRRRRPPADRRGRRCRTSTSGSAAGPPTAQLVSGLVCGGGFSLLKRFSSPSETEPIPLSELAGASLEGVAARPRVW